MIGRRSPSQRRGRDEAEKPFWISYADLMTALMVLFLVVMAVALFEVTRTLSEERKKVEVTLSASEKRQKREAEHKANIEACMAKAVDAARRHRGVNIDRLRNVIDFGDRARFAVDDWRLSEEQEDVLRQFVVELLSIADKATCKSVLKRIVVEGYTDRTGKYLNNMGLSLRRSQSVLCAMFKTEGPSLLTDKQMEAVRDIFLVGGFAFNASRETDEKSRRVEMRIEFLGIDEQRGEPLPRSGVGFGTCPV